MRVLAAGARGAVEQASEVLALGGMVVLPTDTVYGLAALPAGAGKVYAAKGRPAGMNLPVLVGSLAQVDDLGADLGLAGRALAQRFWPGALTLAVGFAPLAQRPGWLEGREEVAVRQPLCSVVEDLAAVAGPLLVTSANRHGEPTPREALSAAACLAIVPDLVLDGGCLSGGPPSTLVNVRAEPPTVERAGAVPLAAIEEVLGQLGARGGSGARGDRR